MALYLHDEGNSAIAKVSEFHKLMNYEGLRSSLYHLAIVQPYVSILKSQISLTKAFMKFLNQGVRASGVRGEPSRSSEAAAKQLRGRSVEPEVRILEGRSTLGQQG